jgi:hypothetical protein
MVPLPDCPDVEVADSIDVDSGNSLRGIDGDLLAGDRSVAAGELAATEPGIELNVDVGEMVGVGNRDPLRVPTEQKPSLR